MALSVVPAFAAGEVASSASTEPSSATEPTKDNVISPVATKPSSAIEPSYTPEKKKVLYPDKCYNSPKTGDAFNETAVYSVIGFSALACGGAAVALAKTSKKK